MDLYVPQWAVGDTPGTYRNDNRVDSAPRPSLTPRGGKNYRVTLLNGRTAFS